MPDRDPDIRAAILHSIKVIQRWTVALFVSVTLVFGAGITNAYFERARVEELATETRQSLCIFVRDLERRVQNSKDFLVEHPDGIPGIPAGVIEQQIRNQERTIASLSGLGCAQSPGAVVQGRLAPPPARAGFLRAVNHAREERGCRPLRETGKYLLRSARKHSVRMANQDRLFHSKLKAGRWSMVGEVVGVGPSWQSIFTALMDSDAHRRLLMKCRFDYLATGIADRDRVWLTGRVYAT